MSIYLPPIERNFLWIVAILVFVAILIKAIRDEHYGAIAFCVVVIGSAVVLMLNFESKNNINTNKVIYINEDFTVKSDSNTVINHELPNQVFIVNELKENIMFTEEDIKELGCFTIFRKRDVFFFWEMTDTAFKICHVNEMKTFK